MGGASVAGGAVVVVSSERVVLGKSPLVSSRVDGTVVAVPPLRPDLLALLLLLSSGNSRPSSIIATSARRTQRILWEPPLDEVLGRAATG